jgi:hypothetical protein
MDNEIAYRYVAKHGEFHHELPQRDILRAELESLEPGQLRILAESPFYAEAKPAKADKSDSDKS